MKPMLALMLMLATQPGGGSAVLAQVPAVQGRWRIDIAFTDTSRHGFRFETLDPGKGALLLLDTRSSLLDPAAPTAAEWTQTGNSVTFSGAVEFPIGNVGRDPGKLVFNGTFDGTDLISGDVKFFQIRPDQKDPSEPAKTGTFKATRILADVGPRVLLLSPEPGRKLWRGGEVEITWEAESKAPIALQQVFLSLDRGKSFVPISEMIHADETRLLWTVPDGLPVVKKALLRIVVETALGDRAEDTSKQTFKIR